MVNFQKNIETTMMEEIPNLKEFCDEIIEFDGKQLIDEFSAKIAAAGVQLPDIGLIIFNGGGSLLFKQTIKHELSRIPMIFSENAIGGWKNANKYKIKLIKDSHSLDEYIAFTL